MNDIHNFKNFKKAKVYVEHIEASLKVINLSISGLAHFEIYAPVHTILTTLREEKKNLELFLKKQKDIISKKGSK